MDRFDTTQYSTAQQLHKLLLNCWSDCVDSNKLPTELKRPKLEDIGLGWGRGFGRNPRRNVLSQGMVGMWNIMPACVREAET